MKRRNWILGLALAGTILALTGCSKKNNAEPTPIPTVEPTETPTPEPTEEAPEEESPDVVSPVSSGEVIPEGMVKSYLTGEYVAEEIGRQRPIAIMLNNIYGALPQCGIDRAGVIYEAPAEGGISRLMGIFEDYQGEERIGSVRSCRDYFIFYAMGFDAVYAHYGQAVYAEKYLNLDEVNNLSGLDQYGDGITYYRSDDRQAPHNVFTDYDMLHAGIDAYGYSMDYSPDYEGYYQFAGVDERVDLAEGQTANTVKIPYVSQHPYFTYNPEEEVYYRFQYDEPHVDGNTGEQLTCKNIILQYSQWQAYDENGYLNIDTSSGGAGKYITNGKAIDITWTKDGEWGVTHYYDASGQEITLNPGRTWVDIVLNDYAGDVVIE